MGAAALAEDGLGGGAGGGGGTRQLVSYARKSCELCHGEYVNNENGWKAHEESAEHRRKATDPSTYASLDKLIAKVPWIPCPLTLTT